MQMVLLLLALLIAGCTTAPPAQPQLERAAMPPGPETPFQGTAGIVEKPATVIKPVVLTAVDTARHGHFDRVVFRFDGDRLPGYRIAYIDRPIRACGSGQAVPVTGDGWLEMRLIPAAAHADGEPIIRRRSRASSLPVLKQLELTCDFEGVVTWVGGLSAPNRYRVLELADPPRLVVDIRH
jgi:hypothetical protein